MMIERIRNARVKVSTNNGFVPSLIIDVNEKYQHVFSPNSRESRLLMQTDMETIGRLFDGGSYLFIDGILRDYRGSNFKGFQHSDEAIAALAEKLGYSLVDPKKAADNSIFQGIRHNLNGAFMGGEWEKFDLDIPAYGDGGKFENRLIAAWSPFRKEVVITVDMLRLKCTNGMVGQSPMVTYEVPVVNDWNNNLEIASRQLKPRFNEKIRTSIEGMADKRASIYEVEKAFRLLQAREAGVSGANLSHIHELIDLTDVGRHLRNHYNREQLERGDLPAHLTRYDVFNILTEATTHIGRDSRSDRAITGYLNEFVFSKEKSSIQKSGIIKLSHDSDHNRAFFTSFKNDE
jgi:hypothetical protein